MDGTGLQSPCRCAELPLPAAGYALVRLVGVDETNGGFGEVTMQRCCACARLWLCYQLEYEGIPASGRYFFGRISDADAATITPEAAIPYLERLEKCLCGGSYFGTPGQIRQRPLPVG